MNRHIFEVCYRELQVDFQDTWLCLLSMLGQETKSIEMLKKLLNCILAEVQLTKRPDGERNLYNHLETQLTFTFPPFDNL